MYLYYYFKIKYWIDEIFIHIWEKFFFLERESCSERNLIWDFVCMLALIDDFLILL